MTRAKTGVGTGAPDDRAAPWTGIVSAALLAAWFVYLLLSPTVGLRWIDSWHNEQRAAQVVLLAATAFLFCAMLLDRRYRLQLPAIPWIVFAVFALGVVSSLRARYIDAAWAELALHFLLLILVVVTAAAVMQRPGRASILAQYGSLLLLGAYSLGVAVRYAAALSLRRPLDVDVLLLGYANPRFPSALHALLIPFVVWLSADPGRPRRMRALSFVVLACTWAINLALATRAIWFAYAVSLPILWALLGRRLVGPATRVAIGSAIAGLLIYALAFKGIPAWLGIGESFQKRSLDQLLWGSNRALLVRSSLEAIRSAPWLGIGPMQFAAIPGVWSAHPHDWVLQLAAEWGLPASALAVYGAIRLLYRGGRRVSDSEGQLSALVPFVAASVVALVYGLVDGNLVMPVSQTAAALALGGSVAAVAPAAAGSLPGTGARLPAALAAALLAVVCASDLVVFSERTVDPMTRAEQVQDSSRPLWPRFWSDGFLPLRSK